MEKQIFDKVKKECVKCGSQFFTIDGDGYGKFWLLCIDSEGENCIHCEDLPKNIKVVKEFSDEVKIQNERKKEQASCRTLNDLIELGRKRGYKDSWAHRIYDFRNGIKYKK